MTPSPSSRIGGFLLVLVISQKLFTLLTELFYCLHVLFTLALHVHLMSMLHHFEIYKQLWMDL